MQEKINEAIFKEINKKYNVIVADPPWKFGQANFTNSANNHYETMTLQQLYDMKDSIKSICNKDCALYMWCPDCFVKDAIAIGEHWGFLYKTIAFVWVKYTKNNKLKKMCSPYGLKSTEVCLLLTKGKIRKYMKKFNHCQTIFEKVQEHSRKPEIVLDTLGEIYDGSNLIELFARRKHHLFDTWGNEIPNDIEL